MMGTLLLTDSVEKEIGSFLAPVEASDFRIKINPQIHILYKHTQAQIAIKIKHLAKQTPSLKI